MDTIALSIFEDPSLSSLLLRMEEGFLPALVSGLSPAHRALLCAGLRLKTGRPVFAVCPDESAAQNFAEDLRSLLREEVRVLTGRDLTLYAVEGVSRQTEQGRLRILDALARGEAPVTVCSVQGLLLRTIPPGTLKGAALTVRVGESCPPEKVEAALLRCGYERTEMVEGPGQFSRRGGILDVFSPSGAQPIRMEFWGDEVDSMGFFDVESQRRTENTDSIRILPAGECLPALAEGGEAELAAALRTLMRRIGRRHGEGAAAEAIAGDIHRLDNSLRLSNADRYISMIYREQTTALDYIPAEALVFLDQPGRLFAAAAAFAKQLADDLRLQVKSGFPAGNATDFFTPWEEAALALSSFPVVMGDAFTTGRIAPEPRSVLQAAGKQLPSYGGSTETALEDVRHYLGLDFRVVVLAQDERRAGLLAEIFEKNGVHPLHGLPDGKLPPKGRCAVAVGALSSGLELTNAALAVLTDMQMLGGGLRRHRRKKALGGRARVGSCADLSVGDLVVHEHHGIGRFAGICRLQVDGVEKDYMKICYAGTDVLYVPATQLDLVSKYIGASGEDARCACPGWGAPTGIGPRAAPKRRPKISRRIL